MEGPESRAPRVLAVTMLALGTLSYLASVFLRYGKPGPVSGAIGSGLVWLCVVSIASWAVLLVRPGRRRLLVGAVTSLLAMGSMYLCESTFMRRQMRQLQARRAKADAHRTLRPGDNLVLPATLSDLDGQRFDLGAYGDRPVVVNVWRTWCGPCRQEMPDLQRLDGRETSLGPVAVLGFSDEPADLLKEARDALEIRFRLIRHEEDLYVLDVDSYPTTFVVHRGRVIDRWIGLRDDLAARVQTAVAKAQATASR
ncbi:MAG TPA: TlpA disulfide reductase family protein [Candidatus Polarisedimenticolaceae bacterium]|nr:TlpA disulfide reductase family protein [Candidatus Polarisedimenticolaceae bacterium]